MNITFYNTTRLDKTTDEFVNDPRYKAAGAAKHRNDIEYMEILSRTIPDKLKLLPFENMPLERTEAEIVLQAFGDTIEKMLLNLQPGIKRLPHVKFKAREIALEPRNYDWKVNLFIRTYNLIEECLAEGTTVYLTIQHEKED